MNLAMDEAMARTFSAGEQTQPSIRIWSNSKSVVVGRFQEAAAEVNLELCKMRNVNVARRFTGGGTVFQDEGTLNFTILNAPVYSISKLQEINLGVVMHALTSLGAPCSLSLPNSILIAGRKVCGASAAVGRRFALWHCSILLDADLRLLELTLAPSKSKRISEFVRSRWQPVTTVANSLSRRISGEEMARSLEHSLETLFGVEFEANKTFQEEERCARVLFAQKYSRDEWNLYGNRGFIPGERTGADHTTIAV